MIPPREAAPGPGRDRPKSARGRRRFLLPIVLLSTALTLLGAWLPPAAGLFRQFEARTYDLRLRLLRDAEPASIDEIVVVDIDRRSIQKLGRYYQWPRARFLRLIDVVTGGGARALAFDVLFDPVDPLADSLFAQGVRAAGNVVLGVAFSASDSSTFLYPMDRLPAGLAGEGRDLDLRDPSGLFVAQDCLEAPMPAALNAARGWGFVNARPDDDGVIRRAALAASFNGAFHPSLALAVAIELEGWQGASFVAQPGRLVVRPVAGPETRLPLDGEGNLLLNFRGPYKTFRYLSFYDVLEERVPPDFFKDRIVLVGSSFAGLADIKSTAIQESYPGVEVHATALHNILHRDPVRGAGPFGTLASVLLAALASALLFGRLRLRLAIAGELLFLALLATTALAALGVRDLQLPVFLPFVAAMLAGTAAIMTRLLGEERERKWIHRAFSHYVSREVVQELVRHPEQLGLGGRRAELSLLFCDIRSFTQLSERCEPEVLGTLLNRYLSVMTQIVLKHGGTLDKYIGDAVVAFFGAPIPLDDHPVRAARAAIEMQTALVGLRKEFAGTPLEGIRSGCGLHCGEVMVGNFGSDTRFSYTAIGDAMNLASRLEGLTKACRCAIVVSAELGARLGDGFHTRRIDRVRVMGKSEAVEIHQLEAAPPEGLTRAAWREGYGRGFEAYQRGRFQEAHGLLTDWLESCPSDGPAAALAARCELLGRSTREGWDGVWTMDRK